MLIGNVGIERGEPGPSLPLELALKQASNALGDDPKRDPLPVILEAQVGSRPAKVLAALLAVLVMTRHC